MRQVDLNKYIASLVDVPTGVKNLADLIAFNIENAKEELIPPFHADQSQSVHSDSRHKLRTANLFVTGIACRLIKSEATNVDDIYHAALAANIDLGRTRGIDATLKKFNLDAILLPTDGLCL